MRCSAIWLCCLFFLVLFASPYVILVALKHKSIKPRFYIQELYVPSLNNSHIYNATNLNTSIIIDLKVKRAGYARIRYQDLNITLYYGSNRSFGAVGSSVIAGFSQGRKTARRRTVVEARGLPWEDAFEKISGGYTLALTAELATSYMVERCDDDGNCSFTKPETMVVAADLMVDGSGVEISKNLIKLHQ